MGIGRLESLEERLTHKSAEVTDKEVEELARQNAATRIQRAWRAKRRASYLGTDFLWTDLATHARFKVGFSITIHNADTQVSPLQVDRNAAIEGKNTARERWRRAIFLALRLQDGNQMLADNRVEDADVARKYLETQHWLELIDG
ncbi:hypothetical protein PHLCEN_2v8785 [Hermanssonia centrifuga]|uniref:Uncharacterized protein n=1 Tax=Hermanssonia centrifuga TaxID=98765 RepID=A0A2R6NSH4_9APHY|nr:hypothetical protein PHLCEN_2v8785 [Hermanssonia centrifuga]